MTAGQTGAGQGDVPHETGRIEHGGTAFPKQRDEPSYRIEGDSVSVWLRRESQPWQDATDLQRVGCYRDVASHFNIVSKSTSETNGLAM